MHRRRAWLAWAVVMVAALAVLEFLHEDEDADDPAPLPPPGAAEPA